MDDLSDSDSLPSVEAIFGWNTVSEEPQDIQRDDIVYAKYRKLYWPALVRNVYQKKKKIVVWFVDAPRKNFTVSLKSVVRFDDVEMAGKIRETAKSKGLVDFFDKLCYYARQFLSKRCVDSKLDPDKFFDPTYPYFAVEEFLNSHPEVDRETFTTTMKVENKYLTNVSSAKGSLSEVPSRNLHDSDASENEESDGVSDKDIESRECLISTEKSETSTSSNFNIQNPTTSSDLESNLFLKKIVSFIQSGMCDKYLKDIYFKKTESYYLNKFEEAKKINDIPIVTYGPFKNLGDLNGIIEYLHDFYKSFLQCEKVPNSHYISSVWLPESIIQSISAINNISTDECRQLFNQNPTALETTFNEHGDQSVCSQAMEDNSKNQMVSKECLGSSDTGMTCDNIENQISPSISPAKKRRKCRKIKS